MDHGYTARFLEKSCVFKHRMIFTVDDALAICGKFSTGEGKVQFNFIRCRFLPRLTRMYHSKFLIHFGNVFTRLPIWPTPSAVSYCALLEAKGSQRFFPVILTFFIVRMPRKNVLLFRKVCDNFFCQNSRKNYSQRHISFAAYVCTAVSA